MILNQDLSELGELSDRLHIFIMNYSDLLRSKTYSYFGIAKQYISGLFQAQKRNMEKMSEVVDDSDQQRLNHFISQSPWESATLIARIGMDTLNELLKISELTGLKIGYVVDECGWRKQGTDSVGVGRQYLGIIGKVDNGQVAVFGSLVCGTERSLINTRLYLPKSWTDDSKRCDKAGIPDDSREYKTKPALALEMIREDRRRGLVFDWVGGDGLYGHDSKFRYGLVEDGERYLLDIHNDDRIYLTHPSPYLPEWKGRGTRPTLYQSNETAIQVREIAENSKKDDWKQYTYRTGTKGSHIRQVMLKEIYTWDGEGATAYKELLIISQNLDGEELKYSLSNITLDGVPMSACELLYLQMQRYWVERSFQDAKSEVGMDEYQVRTWTAWHHHMALSMLALLFMLHLRVVHQEDIPLLSCNDIRWILKRALPKKDCTVKDVLELIKVRHRKRQYDIDRCRKKSRDNEKRKHIKFNFSLSFSFPLRLVFQFLGYA